MSKLGTTVAFRLPPEVMAAVTIHSQHTRVRRSELLRACILERYGPQGSFTTVDSKRLMFAEIALSALLSSHDNPKLQQAVQEAFAERLAKVEAGHAA